MGPDRAWLDLIRRRSRRGPGSALLVIVEAVVAFMPQTLRGECEHRVMFVKRAVKFLHHKFRARSAFVRRHLEPRVDAFP